MDIITLIQVLVSGLLHRSPEKLYFLGRWGGIM